MTKFGAWSWRDLYRLPFALALLPLVRRNYALRKCGLLPDEWYWADVMLLRLGYAACSD